MDANRLCSIVVLSMLTVGLVREDRSAEKCTVASPVSHLRGLPEASGVAIGPTQVLWSMNDSGAPILYALDARGQAVGRVRVAGAEVLDWEALSVGPCPRGTCLYIADIGDNNARRDHITIYRVPEPPANASTTEPAEVLNATYPDGSKDAESLFVTAQGRLFIVTKARSGPSAVYGFPAGFRNGSTVRLQRIGTLAMTNGKRGGMVTDADTSPDGRWTAVRTHETIVFYHTADLISADPRERFRVDVTSLREPQGEGVALGSDGDVYLVGEGGGAGTFARLKCSLPGS